MIIYKATNIINGSIYIGKTTRRLNDRKKQHLAQSGNDNLLFHRAIKKYGKEKFKFEVIFNCLSVKELNEMEKFFIANYKATNELYNMTDGGDGPLHMVHSEESKKRISQSLKGKVVSKETREKLSRANKGQIPWCAGKTGIFSNDVLNKIREKRIGFKHTEECKERISQLSKGRIPWNKGKTGIYSEETRKQISDKLKGRYAGENNPFYGKKHSEETKRRMREAR